MPSKSKKQHNLMEAVAHSPSFAKKVGIKQSVGKDFVAADKGKKFGVGGSPTVTRGGKGQINKQATRIGSVFGEQKEVPNVNINKFIGKKEGGIMKMKETIGSKKMGAVKTSKTIDGIAAKGRTNTKYPKMSGNTVGNGPMVNAMKKGGKC
jgi:hypothetical protein